MYTECHGYHRVEERIAEQIKGGVLRVGQEAREEKRMLEWFEKGAVMVLKESAQRLIASV